MKVARLLKFKNKFFRSCLVDWRRRLNGISRLKRWKETSRRTTTIRKKNQQREKERQRRDDE